MTTKNHSLSRRSFLKLGALSLAACALRPAPSPGGWLRPYPPGEPDEKIMLGRVTRRSIPVYLLPDEQSRPLGRLERDALVYLFEEVQSPAGPAHNPRWYRVEGGYVHSAYIQRVDRLRLNTTLGAVPECGLLGEITMPYSQAYRINNYGDWRKVYRLYFGSQHWITSILDDEAGLRWYGVTDEWLKLRYYVQAAHVRPVPPHELSPLSPEIPPGQKRLVLFLDTQSLRAYEGSRLILETSVATGVPYKDTPRGDFTTNRKTPSKHMGEGALTSDPNSFELPGVPWVTFFHDNGVAFHGTYWHDNFGTVMSHGCVNMRTAEAKWLFRWSLPAYSADIRQRDDWEQTGPGISVQVI